jgi:hypothetical protein
MRTGFAEALTVIFAFGVNKSRINILFLPLVSQTPGQYKLI